MWWRRRTASEERLYQRIEHMGLMAAEAAETIRQLRETARIRAEALGSLAHDLRMAEERVAELESENARLLAWTRQAQNPGDVRQLDPSRHYVFRYSTVGPPHAKKAPFTGAWNPKRALTDPPTAEVWNALYPIGTKVVAYPGERDFNPLHTRTRSEAWTLSDGTPVVKVDGRSGGIGLAWVDPEAPREYGTGDLAESEAPVSACGTCGQPHPDSEPCAGDIKEAA